MASRSRPPAHPSPDAADAALWRRLLARIDVPDCGCPIHLPCDCPSWKRPCDKAHVAPPCRHVRALVPHGLSLEEWGGQLEQVFGREYTERPVSPQAATVLSRAARVAVLAHRQLAGYSLFHPADLWRTSHSDDGVRAGVTQERVRNGADRDGRLVASQKGG